MATAMGFNGVIKAARKVPHREIRMRFYAGNNNKDYLVFYAEDITTGEIIGEHFIHLNYRVLQLDSQFGFDYNQTILLRDAPEEFFSFIEIFNPTISIWAGKQGVLAKEG